MMKLWDKGIAPSKKIEKFTIGNDPALDCLLVEYDIIGNIAHAKMLSETGFLTKAEFESVKNELKKLLQAVKNNAFFIEDSVEDVHSQVELHLTRELGEAGKKIHCARSRNDQVLLDIKLFTREHIKKATLQTVNLFNILIHLSEKYKNCFLPGYTHLQIAMPSSFGLWFGAYAESLTDDLLLLQAAYKICNQNPLGSAAGYGSSFPIDRDMTTKLLGFDTLAYNSIHAQMGRGKLEKIATFALGSVASTLAKMSMDIILFLNQDFNFLQLPEKLSTGSSIMPHKKNPDVFELVRAKCNKLIALPYEISLVTANLNSGYHRDFQLLKGIFIPAFTDLLDCIDMMEFMLPKLILNQNILENERYKSLFSVEEINKLVQNGMPFREAYKVTGEKIKSGKFKPEKIILHTHKGSIGNLCNKEIVMKKNKIVRGFQFKKAEVAIKQLME